MLVLFQRSSHDSPPPQSKSSRKPSRSPSERTTTGSYIATCCLSEEVLGRSSPVSRCGHCLPRLPNSQLTPEFSGDSNSTAWPRMVPAVVGILDFFDGRKWRHLVMQILGVISLVAAMSTWTGDFEDLEPLITASIYCFGVAARVFSLRRNEITCLLGPSGYMMDDYALESDFLDDWRKLSRARLFQMSGFFLLMVISRVSARFLTDKAIFGKYKEVVGFDLVAVLGFTAMAVCYCTACYCALHVTAGLTLAVDSFALRFYSTGDMEAAVMSWNVVQATLRQTSCKLSNFLVLLASSCMGTLILFACQVLSLTLSGEGASLRRQVARMVVLLPGSASVRPVDSSSFHGEGRSLGTSCEFLVVRWSRDVGRVAAVCGLIHPA